jgi:tellurite resistance protein TehA-like permease
VWPSFGTLARLSPQDETSRRLPAIRMTSLHEVPPPGGSRGANGSRAFGARASWLAAEIATLDPGCFALVMATGIISNAFFFAGVRAWSDALVLVNLVALPWLALATLIRAVAFRPALWADLIDPRRVFGFFTIIAGTDVFGAALALRSLPALALALWLVALMLWLLLIYFSFGVLIFLNTARGANVVHGGWLNAIVATQSLVVLGTMIAPTLAGLSHAVFVLIHVLWGVGLGFYGIFIALFAHRIFFADVEPDDVTPLLWVVMGAAAISANAGSTLILTHSGLPFLNAMRPFIDGVTLIVWAWATWWIPLLVLLGVWKHGIRRVPLTYTPMLWSLVFPLGMYALTTARLSLAADFAPLRSMADAMMWIALAAWTATALGLVVASWQSVQHYAKAGADAPARG